MERDLHQSNTARDREEDAPEPPQIRRFRRLVSFTMVTMMIGMLGIMGALVWKLIQSPATVTQSVMRARWIRPHRCITLPIEPIPHPAKNRNRRTQTSGAEYRNQSVGGSIRSPRNRTI